LREFNLLLRCPLVVTILWTAVFHLVQVLAQNIVALVLWVSLEVIILHTEFFHSHLYLASTEPLVRRYKRCSDHWSTNIFLLGLCLLLLHWCWISVVIESKWISLGNLCLRLCGLQIFISFGCLINYAINVTAVILLLVDLFLRLLFNFILGDLLVSESRLEPAFLDNIKETTSDSHAVLGFGNRLLIFGFFRQVYISEALSTLTDHAWRLVLISLDLDLLLLLVEHLS